ncbi:hypothetical protein [Cohnella sp. AR92]|uniref:hypothetical protein n=1 Tax=Cohnella sp. AR92 TaxID=648716 RepID=UPI000F8E4450|nr:hypothetical protein [Cohnella sp. AR92]RUS48500.1 hypothetical protein ELR57_03545 [Cohnella sp. AR92]
MKRIAPFLILFLVLTGCHQADDIQKELSFLPISKGDVSKVKLWGSGVDGREATAGETRNILKWLNGVTHFEKVLDLPSESPAPLAFEEKDLERFIDELAGPSSK